MTPKVTICPPGKAYGYDRETLNPRDRELHDWSRADDYARTVNGKHQAAIAPAADIHIEPRDYQRDPT